MAHILVNKEKFMDIGINWVFLLLQIVNLVLWFSISLVGLVALRRSGISGANQVLWIILILSLPLLGTLLFFIIRRFQNKQP
jgi:hypothetical protein